MFCVGATVHLTQFLINFANMSRSMKYSPLSSGSVSPLPAPAAQGPPASAAVKRYKYLRRLFQFNQMDFEFAFWQMLYLFISPQKVFRNFSYRKQTKSQFARDDPAFLVLFSCWLVLSSIAFSVTLGFGFVKFLWLTLFVIFVDFIGSGLVVATFFWFMSNKYLRLDRTPGAPDVEWGYAFDVHMNAFFPPLSLLHCFQLILFRSLLDDSQLVPCLIVNAVWLASVVYYLYITFLGYSSLGILQNTRVFLLPLPILVIVYLIFSLSGCNLSTMLMNFYYIRVLHGHF